MKTESDYVEILHGLCRIQLGCELPEIALPPFLELGSKHGFDMCIRAISRISSDSVHGYAMPSAELLDRVIQAIDYADKAIEFVEASKAATFHMDARTQ